MTDQNNDQEQVHLFPQANVPDDVVEHIIKLGERNVALPHRSTNFRLPLGNNDHVVDLDLVEMTDCTHLHAVNVSVAEAGLGELATRCILVANRIWPIGLDGELVFVAQVTEKPVPELVIINPNGTMKWTNRSRIHMFRDLKNYGRLIYWLNTGQDRNDLREP